MFDPIHRRTIEWPTFLVAALVYGGWLAATWFHDRLPFWCLLPVGAWVIAWHGSLQHETIHGHPTRYKWVNTLIGGVPLALWLPYRSYAASHIAHHETERVTDPAADPESRYRREPTAGLAGVWAQLQAPLIGRLLLGPIDLVVRLFAQEYGRLRDAPSEMARDWFFHLLGLLFVVAWLAMCHLSLAAYVLLFVYPGTSLSLLRSFAEHKAAQIPGHRVAIIERGGILALLFLNNNLHAAHHRSPGTAWHRLPAYYRANRAKLLQANGDLLYRGYGEIVRRYAFRRHDDLVHPDWQ